MFRRPETPKLAQGAAGALRLVRDFLLLADEEGAPPPADPNAGAPAPEAPLGEASGATLPDPREPRWRARRCAEAHPRWMAPLGALAAPTCARAPLARRARRRAQAPTRTQVCLCAAWHSRAGAEGTPRP
jgi:hypothetical protein